MYLEATIATASPFYGSRVVWLSCPIDYQAPDGMHACLSDGAPAISSGDGYCSG